MPGIEFWAIDGGQDGALYQPTAWDILFIEGTGVAGITECSGAPERKADKQSPAGKSGGAPVLHGRKPATFETTTRIWTSPQWNQFQGVMSTIWPKAGAGPVQAVDIYHPYLANLGIKSAIAQSVVGPVIVNGVGTIKIKWLEFVPTSKKSATKRPAGSVAVRPEFVQSRNTPQFAANGAQMTLPENALQTLPSESASFVDP